VTDRTYDQLTEQTEVASTDLLAVYPAGGPLKKIGFTNFVAAIGGELGSGGYLQSGNNLSDLASASSARANLGLGTSAVLAASALFQVANNLSEVANAATARTNLGAAASNAPSITGGMTLSGTTKATPLAVSGTEIDFSAQEIQTKSISSDTTFSYANLTAGKAQGIILLLTISGGAKPTFPAGTESQGGTTLLLGNGKHWIALLTANGSTVAVKPILKNALPIPT
jgi:hypothetical protein